MRKWGNKNIFSEKIAISADIEIDASNHIVLPGLVNTHHHLFQTLTKAIIKAQNAVYLSGLRYFILFGQE